MKTGAYFQQTADPAAQLNPAGGRLGNPGKDFQQRRLARAVTTDDAHYFAGPNFEAHVAERPNLLALLTLRFPERGGSIGQCLAQSGVGRIARTDAIFLSQIFYLNYSGHERIRSRRQSAAPFVGMKMRSKP